MKLPRIHFWKRKRAEKLVPYRCWMCPEAFKKPNDFLNHLHLHNEQALLDKGVEIAQEPKDIDRDY